MKFKWILPFFLAALCITAFADLGIVPVPPEHITKWKGDPYCGSIDVSLAENDGAIQAKIETDELVLISVTAGQISDYVQLFGDPAAVEKYVDTKPWALEDVEARVMGWVERWEVLQDPFSAFAIYLKKDGRPFIGHIVLGHGSRHGQAELAFLFKPQYHDIRYATQAVTAILHGYAPQIRDKYLANMNNSSVDPSPLISIHATGHFDDTFSGQAMIRSDMKIGAEEELWGAYHFHYLITVDQIIRKMDVGDSLLIEGED
jgi:hypothetical protein